MALSNIFNEPRREITETLIGMVLIGVPLAVDWRLAAMLVDPNDPWRWLGIILVMAMIAIGAGVGLVVLIVFMQVAHATGELICDILDDAGLRLRPQRR